MELPPRLAMGHSSWVSNALHFRHGHTPLQLLTGQALRVLGFIDADDGKLDGPACESFDMLIAARNAERRASSSTPTSR